MEEKKKEKETEEWKRERRTFWKKFLSAHARTLEASGTEGPEATYSDGLISFKPDNDQEPVRKEMTKWKEH